MKDPQTTKHISDAAKELASSLMNDPDQRTDERIMQIHQALEKARNQALGEAEEAAKSVAKGDAENAGAISYIIFCKIRALKGKP